MKKIFEHADPRSPSLHPPSPPPPTTEVWTLLIWRQLSEVWYWQTCHIVCTNIVGSTPEQIGSRGSLNSKQGLCLLSEFGAWTLLCIPNRTDSDIWPVLGRPRHSSQLFFFSLFISFHCQHDNNIHYSPSVCCLVNSWRRACAQLEALVNCQSFTQNEGFAFISLCSWFAFFWGGVCLVNSGQSRRTMWSRDSLECPCSYACLFFYVCCRTSRGWHAGPINYSDIYSGEL